MSFTLISYVLIISLFLNISQAFSPLPDSDEQVDDSHSTVEDEFEWQFDSVDESSNSSQEEPANPVGERLFLTPLIEGRGKSAEYVWREQARVKNISETRSYSGFFTVDKRYNSNLFFWFIPAAYEPDRAPVIVWLNGGPGTSSLFGLFVENGPYKINNQGFLENRQYAWTLTHSVLYIDSPVGTGFSYTDNKKGYAKNQVDVSNNLYEALVQFFQVFSEYLDRDLYIAGHSYAGKYVPSLAMKIHVENTNPNTRLTMNLRGIMIGAGYSDPINQNQYGNYLYNLGLIDETQKAVFLKRENAIKSLIRDESWIEATHAVQSLVVGHPQRLSLFHNMTGFKVYMNLLTTSTPQEYKNYIKYVTSDSVRKEIHVGDQTFAYGKKAISVLDNLEGDICRSVRPKVERLLSLNYKALFYSSQMDIIVPHTGIDRFLRALKWPGAKMFASSPRRPWKVNGDIAGYTKFARNLAYVFIRNAGHVAAHDQPLWVFDMVNRFTTEKPF